MLPWDLSNSHLSWCDLAVKNGKEPQGQELLFLFHFFPFSISFPFSLWQREQSVCAPQDSKELSKDGEEQPGETPVPARGTGGNVYLIYFSL